MARRRDRTRLFAWATGGGAGRRRRPGHRGTRLEVTALETRQLLSTIVVNNPTDTPQGNKIDLRQAIAKAGSGDTIAFDSTVFGSPKTIVLDSANGPLEISKNLTIAGPKDGVTISGGGKSRIFQIGQGVTASLSGLTLADGSATMGGGLYNYGTTTLTDCTLSGNSAFEGGGLINSGTVKLTDCTLSGNSAADTGGGVFNFGTVKLTDCTLSGNSAAGTGGGVFNFGTATFDGTIIAGNSGGDIAGNKNVDSSSSYNLIGSGGSGGLSDGVNHNIVLSGSEVPGLAPLGDYGGPTQTMALLPGSPAIGAGIAVSGVTTDQRGQMRGGVVDIGAVQASLVVESTGASVVTDASKLTLPGAVQLADQFAGDVISSTLAKKP